MKDTFTVGNTDYKIETHKSRTKEGYYYAMYSCTKEDQIPRINIYQNDSMIPIENQSEINLINEIKEKIKSGIQI